MCYSTCLQAQFGQTDLTRDVTSAILQVTEASADMLYRGVFLMIVSLSLRYGIYGSVTVSQRNFGQLPLGVLTSLRLQTISPYDEPQSFPAIRKLAGAMAPLDFIT